MDCCAFCGKNLDDCHPTVVLRAKGSDRVNRASKERGSSVRTQAGQRVHMKCRNNFTNPTRIEQDQKDCTDKLTSRIRRSEIQFNFKEHCLFCGQPAKYEDKKRRCAVFPVRTKNFQSEIIRTCEKRKDDWSNLVAGRIAFAHDLHAADAIYHQICSVNFRTLTKLPQQFSATIYKS